MRRHAVTRLLASLAALAWAVSLGFSTPLHAQTTTGSIRGVVRSEAGPLAGASVIARNTETNEVRQALTNSAGIYFLGGMRPATYEMSVQMLGFGEQRRTVQLLLGRTTNQNFDLTTQAVEIAALEVTAVNVGAETRTSEVATNITQQQIQDLPSSDRNFLGLVVLAPGTQLQGDRVDGTRKTFTSGAQGADQVNVFIDGASYKNDILQGGVAGQDASRGSPFPRNAVREFRVITQNFKAEYQKASSAIISATTQSGTNEWQSHAFLTYQHEGLIALDTFQRAETNLNRPDFKRYQGGLSVGGPIRHDKIFFFGSVERNDQNRGRRVNIVPPTGFGGDPNATYPALDTVNFAQYNGEFDEPFEAWLGFAKVTYNHRPGSTFEVSYNLRTENDIRDFGGFRSFQSATRFENDVNTAIAKHTLAKGSWLNEATVSYQNYHYNPGAANPGMVKRLYGFGCCAQIGSFESDQDFRQQRFSLRNDLSRSGLRLGGEHLLKGGVNVDFANYDIFKGNSTVPLFVFEPWFFDFRSPQRVEFNAGDPNFEISNTQVGAYIQDDWSPIQRLVLNLGVRWDFETDMMNYDFVTPAAVRTALTTHRDSLLFPFDPDRYFTDGNDRKPWYGAIQPRLGFSLALDRDNKTSIFGGWGIFYDRVVFDYATTEAMDLQYPRYRIEFLGPGQAPDGRRAPFDPRYLSDPNAVKELVQNAAFNTPEIKLIPNDLKPPKAQHFNFGARRALGQFELSAAYTGVRSENIFTYNWANEDRPCAQRLASCRRRTNIPGFSTVLIGDDQGKTWYDAVQVKLDRPYRTNVESGWGWGAGLAVNFAKRETEGFNDLFTHLNRADFPKGDRNDEPYRVVANWVVDVPFAWGIQFSGLMTLGAGARMNVGSKDFGRVDLGSTDPRALEFGGFEPEKRSFILPDAFAYRMVDLRLRKDFPGFRGQRVGVSAEVFNVFNYDNFGSYVLFNRDADNFGQPTGVMSDARRLQIGLEYDMN